MISTGRPDIFPIVIPYGRKELSLERSSMIFSKKINNVHPLNSTAKISTTFIVNTTSTCRCRVKSEKPKFAVTIAKIVRYQKTYLRPKHCLVSNISISREGWYERAYLHHVQIWPTTVGAAVVASILDWGSVVGGELASLSGSSVVVEAEEPDKKTFLY